MLRSGVERLILEARTSLEPKEMAQETRDGSWGRSRAGLQGAAWVHHQGSASNLRLGIKSRQAGPSRTAARFIRSQIPSRNERALNSIISWNASLISRNPLPLLRARTDSRTDARRTFVFSPEAGVM